jgi:hypothetical protein
MLPSALVLGLLGLQSPPVADITPELACGPAYHEFSPPLPSPSHAWDKTSVEAILSSGTVVEGTVLSKKTYFRGGPANDVSVRITKVLRGSRLAEADVITVQVEGGYAPDGLDKVCYWDDIADGMRVEVGKSYLLSLTKESETPDYRTAVQGGWFRIAKNGDVIPLTLTLVRGKSLAGKKIADFEAAAKASH